MLSVLAILIAAVAVVLCAVESVSCAARAGKIVAWMYGAVCALGILFCGMGCASFSAILHHATATEEQIAWASDAVWLGLRTGGLLTLLIGGTVLVAALIRHPLVRIRRVVACAGAILMTLLGRGYAAMCVAETVSPAVPVQWFTAGFTALMLCGSFVDALYFARHPDTRPRRRKRKNSTKSGKTSAHV